MFAILKFQQRTNAATFSHAFVLTIRIYPSSEHSLSNLKYPAVKEADAGSTFKDLHVPLDTEEKITRTAICTDKVSPRKIATSQNKEDQISKYNEDTLNKKTSETKVSNLQDNIKNPEDFESLNAIIKNATTTDEVHFINKEFQDNLNENKSTNCNIKKCKRRMNQHPIDHGIKSDIDKWTLSSGFDFYENSMEKNICSLNDKDDNGRTISETIVNLNNIPDQYNKSYKARKQKSKESEKKTVSDDKILRSSNITDLVMEGLMFTIRQDQDSVAVIEQKTKLEMDEVLENSEKVETKAGEKSLVNSSLLRLENLVTMIDTPREHKDKDQQHKSTCHSICNNMCLQQFFPSDAVYNLDVNNVDEKMDKLNIRASYGKHNVNIKDLYPCERWPRKRISSSINNSDDCSAKEMITERSEQLKKQQDYDNKYDRKDKDNIEKEREKRNILEVFPSVLFSEKKNAELQNRDLLTNSTDTEETSKHEMSVKKFYSSNNSLSYSLSNPKKIYTKRKNSIISEESGSTKLSRLETNSLRIVSDKSITVEQIPLALQKVLHRTHKLSSTSNNSLQHDTILTEKTTSETAISYMDNNINSNITNNSSVELTLDSEEIKSYNDESCGTIDKDSSDINKETCLMNTKEEINESHRASRRSSSSKNGSPRKLQDITEDFYYDLLHAHKDNAIRQRCLRQRQRSLNNPNNIKNCEMRIEMLKFIQDITEGARVVVRRLNIDNKSNLLEKKSTSATCTH